jgi:hypothetical protein
MPRSGKRPAPTAAKAVPALRTGAGFRKRYDELERQRQELVDRLALISKGARGHPACKRASKLLNETYRRSSLTQRLGILQAASWLLAVIEGLSPTL